MEENTFGIENGMVSILQKADIDIQIQTSKKYPRILKKFLNEATEMVTFSEKVAGECMYSLPRREKQADGTYLNKTIEGPAIRFAEICLSAWGNSRAGARIIDDSGDFVIAQGVMHDLERNIAITYEVRRKITGRDGKRFSNDMVVITSNAACAIALRNAILKGIPKAFWSGIYDAAKESAIGSAKTLVSRRDEAFSYFQKMGVLPESIFHLFDVSRKDDISLEHLATLRGIATALKEGDTTIEEVFYIQKTGADAVRAENISTVPKWMEGDASIIDSMDDAEILRDYIEGQIDPQKNTMTSLKFDRLTAYAQKKLESLSHKKTEAEEINASNHKEIANNDRT